MTNNHAGPAVNVIAIINSVYNDTAAINQCAIMYNTVLVQLKI